MPSNKELGRGNLFVTKFDMFKQISERRNMEAIEFSSNLRFNPIPESVKSLLSYYEHEWKRGDKFYKLADLYYGDVDYWWVIPLFNNKPTEFHFKAGDKILVPVEIDFLIEQYGF